MQARRSSLLYNKVHKINPIPQNYSAVWEPDSASNKVYIEKTGNVARHFSCGRDVTFQTSVHGTGKAFRFPSSVNSFNRYDVSWCTNTTSWTNVAVDTGRVRPIGLRFSYIIENFILHGLYGEDLQCLFIKRMQKSPHTVYWAFYINGKNGRLEMSSSSLGGKVVSSDNFVPVGIEGKLGISIDRSGLAAFSFTPYDTQVQKYFSTTNTFPIGDPKGSDACPSIGGWPAVITSYPGATSGSNYAPSNCTIGMLYQYNHALLQNEM